jgi:hypothetical protein
MSDRSDQSDQATKRDQIQREEAALFRKPTVKACGYCHYCSEPVASGMQFCDGVDCRNGFEWERQCKERNGQ